MGDRLVGCASYTMSEFHVRNYMARRPHINQEPNVGTSAVAIMCVELIECHSSGQTKEEYPVWKSSTSLSETSPYGPISISSITHDLDLGDKLVPALAD